MKASVLTFLFPLIVTLLAAPILFAQDTCSGDVVGQLNQLTRGLISDQRIFMLATIGKQHCQALTSQLNCVCGPEKFEFRMKLLSTGSDLSRLTKQCKIDKLEIGKSCVQPKSNCTGGDVVGELNGITGSLAPIVREYGDAALVEPQCQVLSSRLDCVCGVPKDDISKQLLNSESDLAFLAKECNIDSSTLGQSCE